MKKTSVTKDKREKCFQKVEMVSCVQYQQKNREMAFGSGDMSATVVLTGWSRVRE